MVRKDKTEDVQNTGSGPFKQYEDGMLCAKYVLIREGEEDNSYTGNAHKIVK